MHSYLRLRQKSNVDRETANSSINWKKILYKNLPQRLRALSMNHYAMTMTAWDISLNDDPEIDFSVRRPNQLVYSQPQSFDPYDTEQIQVLTSPVVFAPQIVTSLSTSRPINK